MNINAHVLYLHAYIIEWLLRSMITNSKAWAAARGLVRKSPIHGEDEWKFPMEETFEQEKSKGSRSSQGMHFEAQE